MLDRACAGWVREVLPCGWVKIVLCGIIWDYHMIWGYHMIWDRQMIWGNQMIMGLFDDMGLSDYMVSECIGLYDVLVVLCFQVRPSHLGTKGAQNFLVMLCNLPSLLIILTYPHLHHNMDRT